MEKDNWRFSEIFPKGKDFSYFKAQIDLFQLAQWAGYKEVKRKSCRNRPVLEDSTGDRIILFRGKDNSPMYKSLTNEEKGSTNTYEGGSVPTQPTLVFPELKKIAGMERQKLVCFIEQVSIGEDKILAVELFDQSGNRPISLATNSDYFAKAKRI